MKDNCFALHRSTIWAL